MFRFSFVLLMALAFVVPAGAADGLAALFDTQTHNFGGVPYGPSVMHSFTITNTTNQTLQIGGLRVSCGCITPSASAYTIAPGKSATVNAQMEVWQKLRAISDPEISGIQRGFSGDTGSPIGAATAVRPSRRNPAEPPSSNRVLYQTKVSSFVKNAMDVTAQVTLSADRRTARLSLTPVVTPAATASAAPVVTNPLIPGN